MAEQLELQYIWINALCIVQDDPEDWKKEAQTMCRLYNAAHITQAVSHGFDGDAGVFLASDAHDQVVTLKQSTTSCDGKCRESLIKLAPVIRSQSDSEIHRIISSQENIFRHGVLSEPLLRRA